MPANVTLAAFGLFVVALVAWAINAGIEAAKLGMLG